MNAVIDRRAGSTPLSAGFKKLAQKSGRFVGKDAPSHIDAVIHSGMIKDSETGAYRTSFGIVRAIDEPVNARLKDCPRTHGTGLNRYVKSGPR
jgi:hypothetical protein